MFKTFFAVVLQMDNFKPNTANFARAIGLFLLKSVYKCLKCFFAVILL